MRTEHQLAAGVAASDGYLIDIGINRTRPDFTERDRRVLDALRGHLAGAQQNARRFSAVERDLALVVEGTDGTDAGVVVLGPDGTIRMANRLARRLIESCFGPSRFSPKSLPSALARWVQHEDRALARADEIPARRRPLVVDHEDRRVVIRLFLDAGRAVLILTEEFSDLDPSLLTPFGLSGRETEVLAWVARGKTDAEIATIVGARPRTVSASTSSGSTRSSGWRTARRLPREPSRPRRWREGGKRVPASLDTREPDA